MMIWKGSQATEQGDKDSKVRIIIMLQCGGVLCAHDMMWSRGYMLLCGMMWSS